MSLIPFKSNLAAKSAYNPFYSFRDEFDKLFENYLSTVPSSQKLETSMVDFRINVIESEKHITVKAELPGVEEQDIDVQLTRDILTIRGEKKLAKEETEKNYHLVECSYG